MESSSIVKILSRLNSDLPAFISTASSHNQIKPLQDSKLIKEFIETKQFGELKKSQEVTNNGRILHYYGYELSKWSGAGNCINIGYYLHDNFITGIELFFNPYIENKNILTLFREYILFDKFYVSKYGLEAINYNYLTTENEFIMTLSADCNNPNVSWLLTFFHNEYAIET